MPSPVTISISVCYRNGILIGGIGPHTKDNTRKAAIGRAPLVVRAVNNIGVQWDCCQGKGA